jgi:hypothetical protein
MFSAIFQRFSIAQKPKARAEETEGNASSLHAVSASTPPEAATPQTSRPPIDPEIHPCHRCGAANTVHVKYGIWCCPKCFPSDARDASKPRNSNVQRIESEDASRQTRDLSSGNRVGSDAPSLLRPAADTSSKNTKQPHSPTPPLQQTARSSTQATRRNGKAMSTEIRRELRRLPCGTCRGIGTSVREQRSECNECNGRLWILNASPEPGAAKEVLCHKCSATGIMVNEVISACDVCDGRGYRIQIVAIRQVESFTTCTTCGGRGRFFSRAKTCPKCHGEGCTRCQNEGAIEGNVECDICDGTGNTVVYLYEDEIVRED